MTGYEESLLLARTEMLEDTGDLIQAITAVLAGARAAGVDRTTIISLAAAARVLDPGTDTSYDPGGKHDRQPGSGYRSDGEFLEAAAEAEADVAERLHEAGKLREQVATALKAGQDTLAAAPRSSTSSLSGSARRSAGFGRSPRTSARSRLPARCCWRAPSPPPPVRPGPPA